LILSLSLSPPVTVKHLTATQSSWPW